MSPRRTATGFGTDLKFRPQLTRVHKANTQEFNVPPNSNQKLTRPGAGPPAEPARQHTRMRGGMPPDILSLRFQRSERAGVTPRRLRHVGPGRAV